MYHRKAMCDFGTLLYIESTATYYTICLFHFFGIPPPPPSPPPCFGFDFSGKAERQEIHLVVHYADIWGWAKQKPGAYSMIQVSQAGSRGPSI